MEPIQLFDLATRQAQWLAVKQKTVADNIANANTPGFNAREVVPFSIILDHVPVAMAQTHAKHMDVAGGALEGAAIQAEKSREMTHSGNNVVIEDELMKGSEAGRDMSVNTSLVRSFHRMMMMTVKGN